jgi:hypothetical protein
MILMIGDVESNICWEDWNQTGLKTREWLKLGTHMQQMRFIDDENLDGSNEMLSGLGDNNDCDDKLLQINDQLDTDTLSV